MRQHSCAEDVQSSPVFCLHWCFWRELCFLNSHPLIQNVIKVLLSHCSVHQSQNLNDVFVFGSTCFVMPNPQFALLLSANIKENLSRFPHTTLFFPVLKWVVVIVINFPC